MSFKSSGKSPKPNTFLEKKALTNRERGDLHEVETAKKVGGRAQPNSGASPWLSYKADVSSEDFLYQCKTTDKDRYTLSKKVIAEIYRQAKLTGKDPAIVIRLEAVPEPLPCEWVAVPIETWRRIIGEDT
jgi:hypothetical protein